MNGLDRWYAHVEKILGDDPRNISTHTFMVYELHVLNETMKEVVKALRDISFKVSYKP